MIAMTVPGGAVGALFASKLHPPATTTTEVVRSAICELVLGSHPAKLILVRAAAGFGKTTAMVQCRTQFAQRGIDTAWLTIDRADNDASRFLSCLAGAVAGMTAERDGPRADQASRFSLGDLALDIMEQLAMHGAPFALFLDDFELVQEPTVLELVRELIDHLPRNGQLIIGSRGLPDLGMGRLRARGQLLEIDVAHLRFSLSETAEFLALRRQIALPDAELHTLHHKTEGWAAALWLASLALETREGRSEFIAGFSGSHEALAEYLADDVLARQPAALRQFLIQTSILRHLNGSLCDALLERSDSARLLQQLDAANLFLVPIEGQAGTFRYHSLFADFLRAQLLREQPGQVPRLHRAAAAWYESQGRPVPALDHALDACDFEHAVKLLGLHAEQLLEQGRMRLLTRWFAAIPPDALESLPLLQAVHVWALCFTRGPEQAMALLDRSQCADSDDPAVLAYVQAVRPAMLTMMDRNDEACRIGAAAMAGPPLARPFAETALTNQMAYLSYLMGQRQKSHQLLDAARSQGDSGSFFNRMYSESVEGLIDLEEGRLRQASARFRLAVGSTHAASYTHTHGNAFAGVLYADALYEANQLVEAAHLLHVYLPLAKDVGLADHMIIAYLRLARIAFQSGDIDMVFQRLTELEYVGHHRHLDRVVASAKLERARTLLLQGNRQASRDELQRCADPALWKRVRKARMPAHDLDYLELGQWRWEIHFGDAARTLPVLDAAITEASAHGRLRRSLKLRLLRALALKAGGDLRAAQAAMGEVLAEGAREGFLRLIMDEGDSAASLVRAVACDLGEHASPRADPLFALYLHKLLDHFGPAESGPAPEPPPDSMTDPLTPKEIRILLLLADGYSNIALAEKLFVSDSTVRTHLRKINAKLRAESRTQAVAIARRMGIIH